MEDIDDDFGDLYVDVEGQASSAINGVHNFTPFCTEPDEEEDNDNNNSDDDNKIPNPHPSSESDNGSDSEDDLNIVLNDEDYDGKFKTFPIEKHVVDMKNDEDEDGFVAIKEEQEEKIKYIRTHGSSIPSDVKANVCTSLLASGDWKYNVRGRQKGPSPGHNDLVGATRNSVMAQNRYGFSLPWYRSILDVNIDKFEEKPWRHPGVDITDFFNFGFNEDSWRQYCNSLEQFRSSSFTELGNSNHVSRNQACEAGSKYDEQVKEMIADKIGQPKGRAIQVEDGSGERQPSVDVWRPRDRDSDVVIQITLEDPVEDTSDIGEKLNHSSSTQCETSYKEGFDATDCNDGRGDEFSVESLENDKKADRCYAKTTASNPMTNDPDDTEKNQSSDVDGNHHEETCGFSSDGTTELPESVNAQRESIVLKACSADQYMVESELLLEEEGQLSLTSSCFEIDSDTSTDDSQLDHGKVTSPIGRSSVKSGVELWDSDTSIPKNLQGNYAKIKPVDYKDYSKCKCPAQGGRNHWTRSVDSPAQRKIKRYDNNTSPGFDAEDMYDKGHLPADCVRWKENLEDVNFMDKDLAYHEKSKRYHYYGSREFAKDHTNTARKNYRKRNQDFHEERDPYLIENWKEREYLCEDERREGYLHRRGPFPRDMPLIFKKTGQLVSRYSAANEELDFRSKRRNKLEFMKPTSHGSRLPDYELDDADFMQEKYERSVSLINRKRDTLDESCERQGPKRSKEVKSSGWKRYNDACSLELEGSWSREIEDEYWRKTDAHYLSHHSRRELDEERWTKLEGSWSSKVEDVYRGNTDVHRLSCHSYRESDGGRWTDHMSPRNCVSRSRFVERYRRQLPAGEGKENGWLETYNDSRKFEDSFIYPEDGVHFRRKRRCGWKSVVLPWMEEDLTIRHQDEKLNFKKSSFFCKNDDGRHRRNQSTHGSLHDAMHLDGSNIRCIYRSRKMYKAKNEQAFLRCRNSVDLFVGKGKLSRRRLADRNLSCNSRLEDTSLEDFDESPRYKSVQSNLSKVGLNHRNEDFQDQFLLAVRSEDFDIEEGQIVTEEPHTGPLERKPDSASAAHGHSAKKRMLEDDLVSHGSKTGGECDDQRILETLAKMERRRERFKEPIAFKRVQDKCTKPDDVPSPTVIETPDTKQPRPARKRQWCAGQGSSNVTPIS